MKFLNPTVLGTSVGAFVYKGVIDASLNPNYPAADSGDVYVISVAGKVGGAAGKVVEVGDMIFCNTDSTPAGDEAAVGARWDAVQGNIPRPVSGPASSINNNIAAFNGTTGQSILDSGSSSDNLLKSTTINDEAFIDLPTTNGFGEIFIGNDEERVRFSWTTAGVVTLIENTANIRSTDTDTFFCIFDNGANVRIKNRLGSSKIIKYIFNY